MNMKEWWVVEPSSTAEVKILEKVRNKIKGSSWKRGRMKRQL